MNKSWIFCIPILAILWASLCPDWRNWLQKCIRATRSCFFKAWTIVALHGRSLTILWPFVRMLSKHLSPPLSCEIFCGVFQRTHIWNTAALKMDAVQQFTWAEACHYITEGLRNVFTNKGLKIHSANQLSPTAEVTLCIIGCSFWSLHSSNLTPCEFYLWGNCKDKVHKTNSHTPEELRNIRRETWTADSRVCTECIRPGGQQSVRLKFHKNFGS
jgi:hypothetical protein